MQGDGLENQTIMDQGQDEIYKTFEVQDILEVKTWIRHMKTCSESYWEMRCTDMVTLDKAPNQLVTNGIQQSLDRSTILAVIRTWSALDKSMPWIRGRTRQHAPSTPTLLVRAPHQSVMMARLTIGSNSALIVFEHATSTYGGILKTDGRLVGKG
jgi:hypothetical protein